MPEYDAENFDPPAPVAFVTLRNPATGVMLPDVPMLIDTGADAILLPASMVQKIGVEIETDPGFEAETFDGETKQLITLCVETLFLLFGTFSTVSTVCGSSTKVKLTLL